MERKPGGQRSCSRVAPTSSYVKDMGTKTRRRPGGPDLLGGAPLRGGVRRAYGKVSLKPLM